MIDVPSDLIDFVREEFANRPEIGAVFWRKSEIDGSIHAYSYAETVAIVLMMLKGWSMDDAASIVDAGLVLAVPYVSGVESSRIGVPDFVYGVAKAKLADGSIWDVLGDLDLPHAQDIIAVNRSQHGAMSIRGLELSDDPTEVRVGHLVTCGEINETGRFIIDLCHSAPKPQLETVG